VGSILGLLVSFGALIAIPVGMKLMRSGRRRRNAKRALRRDVETFR
jgi:hypothetical protein